MQQKVKDFNVFFTHKMNTHQSGVSDEKVLNATKNEYREGKLLEKSKYFRKSFIFVPKLLF